MTVKPVLESQPVRSGIREVGINPNYWYAVEWSKALNRNQVMAVTLWQQSIALYRDTNGQLHALEDACPHRGVALHKGKVQGTHLACRYHGWELDGSGACVRIPYLASGQKLPCAHVRSYPVEEKYGLIWIFPGDPTLAAQHPLPNIPEFSQPGWLAVPVTVNFKAHFSICNENTMDVFHGFLHEDLQGWFNPVLLSLQETETAVSAEYQISYKGQLARFLRLSDRAHRVTTATITICYEYPHYRSTLQGLSSLYLMRLPISPTASKSFSFFFLQTRLPGWVLNGVKPLLQLILERWVFLRFIALDAEMVESEQQTYQRNPSRRYVEINPAIIALQRLTIRQYERFLQTTQPSASTESDPFCQD